MDRCSVLMSTQCWPGTNGSRFQASAQSMHRRTWRRSPSSWPRKRARPIHAVGNSAGPSRTKGRRTTFEETKRPLSDPRPFAFNGAVNSVPDLLFQDLDQLADAAAVVVDDGGEFLAVGVGEAEAFDLHVGDLVAVAGGLD